MNLLRRLFSAAILSLGAGSAGALEPPSLPPALPPAVAGRVDFVEGDVALVKPDKTRVRPRKADELFAGDIVVTGAGAEVHFAMADGGYIAVRPNSRIRIAQYQANGDDDDKSIIGVVQGSLRVVTGWIGMFNPKGYQVRSSFASVGVRGTDHETLVRAKDDAEGEAGLYDRVYAGRTVIQSKAGRVEVTANHAGFHSSTRPGGPRLLERIPAFFRPTRNEHLIEGRHARVQSQLQRLRDEQRQRNGLPPAPKKDAASAGRENGAKAANQKRNEQQKAAEEKRKAAPKAKAEKKKEHE